MSRHAHSVDGWVRERRQQPRTAAMPGVRLADVRIRAGGEMSLLDVSVAGVLVEGRHRLVPGASVELCVTTGTHRAMTRAHVVRASVSRVSASTIWYRGALVFEHRLAWLEGETDSPEHEYQVPVGEAAIERRREVNAHVRT